MNIICTGRKVSLKESFEDRVAKGLAKFDKYFSSDAEAKVTVTVEKDWQTVEITVHDKGFTCRAEKDAERMEDAFDYAVDLLERRILKNRKKLADKVNSRDLSAMFSAAPEDDFAAEDFSIIREKRFTCKPATAEEAILNMEMLGHTFYLFRDADSDDIRLVYTRKDGSYGVLIPEK